MSVARTFPEPGLPRRVILVGAAFATSATTMDKTTCCLNILRPVDQLPWYIYTALAGVPSLHNASYMCTYASCCFCLTLSMRMVIDNTYPFTKIPVNKRILDTARNGTSAQPANVPEPWL